MSALKALFDEQDQSVWLDFVARGFIEKGELKALIERDGLRGVTSNPAIFEKAIGASDEYDGALKAAEGEGDRSVIDLYEGLTVADIQHAADVLRPVYEASAGGDGFVSLEVSPYLALDTTETLAEGRRLWGMVDRPNLMIKVPATAEGLPAMRDLIADGINVNVTLLFAQSVYEDVAKAYIEGLERRLGTGGAIDRVASVASFFVSRIDSAVDKRLDEKIAQANDPDEKAALEALKGKVAIANARLAYQRYKGLFAGGRWGALAEKGAKPQRMLWASTGTKSKALSDVVYVEELIGANTVNTIPPATMDAFRDHGRVRASLEEGIDEASAVLARLERAGISLDEVATQLVEEGVQLFIDAADKVLGAVADKRAKLIGGGLNGLSLALGKALDEGAKREVEAWRAGGAVRKLWHRDKALWTGADEDRWLGWLGVVEAESAKAADYAAFADEVRNEGFADAVVLGMGGSSLGPEVLAQTYGRRQGFPRLSILDSTDPAQVRALDARLDLKRTLFIVSSKSGSTLEPNIFRDYFLDRVRQVVGAEGAGRHFVAVTDPGSKVEASAKADGFRRVFHGDPSIGGRYSVLSAFGLVPAAAAGIDVGAFLASAMTMVRSCGPDVPPAKNLGVLLGTALGIAATTAGRDKVTLVASPGVADFGAWAEQLIAESTGKEGKGLIPVDDEPLGSPAVYGADRFFVYLRLNEGADPAQDAALDALERAGHPVARLALASPESLPQEFFRLEVATAVAGAVLGINPFDQPDVEASKIKTRELTTAFETAGSLPSEAPVAQDDLIAIYTDARNAEALGAAGSDPAAWVRAHLARLKAGDYLALLAYVERNEAHRAALQGMRVAVRDARRVATCVGFGPRFLHSTGQAYKGGPNTGVFVQVTADSAQDLAVPGLKASFGTVIAAQARGDFEVLAERGRRALRVHVKGGDVAAGLVRLDGWLRAALA